MLMEEPECGFVIFSRRAFTIVGLWSMVTTQGIVFKTTLIHFWRSWRRQETPKRYLPIHIHIKPHIKLTNFSGEGEISYIDRS
jgi:hypothetical protein